MAKYLKTPFSLKIIGLCIYWLLNAAVFTLLPDEALAAQADVDPSTLKVLDIFYKDKQIVYRQDFMDIHVFDYDTSEYSIYVSLFDNKAHKDDVELKLYNLTSKKLVDIEFSITRHKKSSYPFLHAKAQLDKGHLYRLFTETTDKVFVGNAAVATHSIISADTLCNKAKYGDAKFFHVHSQLMRMQFPKHFSDIHCKRDKTLQFEGGNLLKWAAFYSRTKSIDFLVTDLGVDINTLDRDGKTLLDWINRKIRFGYKQHRNHYDYPYIKWFIVDKLKAKSSKELKIPHKKNTDYCVTLNHYKANDCKLLTRLCVTNTSGKNKKWYVADAFDKKIAVSSPINNLNDIISMHTSPNGRYFSIRTRKDYRNRLTFYRTSDLLENANLYPMRVFDLGESLSRVIQWQNDFEVVVSADYEFGEMPKPFNIFYSKEDKYYKLNLLNRNIEPYDGFIY